MKRAGIAFWASSIAMVVGLTGWVACTVKLDPTVTVPQPKITISCVLIELPGGVVRTCDAGLTAGGDDAGD